MPTAIYTNSTPAADRPPVSPSLNVQNPSRMLPPFRISDYLRDHEPAVAKLQHLTNILGNLDEARISLEQQKLTHKLAQTTGFTKALIDHLTGLHEDYAVAVARLVEEGKLTRAGLSRYFTQGWYHTSYTAKFERMFTNVLMSGAMERPESLADVNSDTNKFTKMIEHDVDEEEGHEFWALQDVQFLGVQDTIDVQSDVFPETKGIVWSQHDRLTRLPVVGFLGYSFYLEYMIATRSTDFLTTLNTVFDTQPTDHKFIYFHWVVDQGHAVDNIELLERMVQTEEDYREVIDNMNFIHAMYKGLTIRSFTS